MGSPRKNGNTSRVLRRFEQLVSEEHAVTRANIGDYHVGGCTGCGSCQQVTDEPGCRQGDGGLEIIEAILAVDFVVYATPLYAWGFPSQLKALVDRHYCMLKGDLAGEFSSLMQGKRAALAVTCLGGAEGNADLIQIAFDRMMHFAGCAVTGKYVVPFCGKSVPPDGKIEETARRMAAGLEENL
jgi:multimeric flavodoxin WrbA